MQAQIVEGRVIQVSPQLAVKLGHVVIGGLRSGLDGYGGLPFSLHLNSGASKPTALAYSDFACFIAFGAAARRPRLRSCTSCSAFSLPDSRER